METNTAKNFVLQLGSLASLYISLSFLIVLLFNIINLTFPDPGEGYWAVDSASSSVRLGIAMVVVFLPTYLLLTRTVNRIRRQENSGVYLVLMKWLIYLSLLIGGAVLLGDLVAVIMTFLEGEITQRFVLKALAVLAVIGAAFYYYLLDARGWWIPREKESVYYGVGAALVALVAVVYGFTLIESPASEQEQNIDQRQIQDLTTIQNRIETYYVTNNNTLPESLDRLQGGVALPEAPEGRGAYEYRKSAGGFELCATFAYPSQNEFESQPAMDNTMLIKNAWDWGHGAGYYCFERVVSAPVKS